MDLGSIKEIAKIKGIVVAKKKKARLFNDISKACNMDLYISDDFEDIADFIKAVQSKEGNEPCYATMFGCEFSDCCWFTMCQEQEF